MAEFTVLKNAGALDETVPADHMYITDAGVLVFSNYIDPPITKRPRRYEMVRAFAPGRWLEVTRVDPVT